MNENIELNQTKDKTLSIEEVLIKEIFNNFENPYKLLTVIDVSKDLKIGINTAYELFKNNKFPSIKIGKNRKVTLLAYTLWKLQKN